MRTTLWIMAAICGLLLIAGSSHAFTYGGKSSLAVNTETSIPTGPWTPLASGTIARVKPRTLIFVQATVTGINDGVRAAFAFNVDGFMSHPSQTVNCTDAWGCSLTLTGFFDSEGKEGEPLPIAFGGYSATVTEPNAKVFLTAQMIKK